MCHTEHHMALWLGENSSRCSMFISLPDEDKGIDGVHRSIVTYVLDKPVPGEFPNVNDKLIFLLEVRNCHVSLSIYPGSTIAIPAMRISHYLVLVQTITVANNETTRNLYTQPTI